MIPNMIKRLPSAAYRGVRHPNHTLASIGKGLLSAITALLIGSGNWIGSQDTQGDFNLPKALRPLFFIGAYGATMATATYYLFWVRNELQSSESYLEVAKAGATIAPGFLTAILMVGLLSSPLLYVIFWGAGMLGLIFRKWEDKTRPERTRQIEELKKANEEKDHIIDTLRNQVTRSGQEPEA